MRPQRSRPSTCSTRQFDPAAPPFVAVRARRGPIVALLVLYRRRWPAARRVRGLCRPRLTGARPRTDRRAAGGRSLLLSLLHSLRVARGRCPRLRRGRGPRRRRCSLLVLGHSHPPSGEHLARSDAPLEPRPRRRSRELDGLQQLVARCIRKTATSRGPRPTTMPPSALNPRYAVAYLNRGHLRHVSRRHRRRSRRLGPGGGTPADLRGRAHEPRRRPATRGDAEGAVQDLEAATRLKPEYFAAWYNLASAYAGPRNSISPSPTSSGPSR